MIEKALSRWSVLAGLFFTTLWASVAVAWAVIDTATQSEIMADLGLSSSPGKLVAYFGLAAALSNGATLALRVVKQKAKQIDEDDQGKLFSPTIQQER